MTAKVLALFVITVITSIFYGHNYFINILACFRKIGNSLIIEPILFATRSVRVTSISLFFLFFFIKKSGFGRCLLFLAEQQVKHAQLQFLVLQIGINFLMDHRDVPFITILHDLQNTTTSSRTSSPFLPAQFIKAYS